MMAKDNPIPASKIVSAVGVASVAISPGGKALSKQIETAMSKAVLDCADDGITDPKKIKERMLMAREEVKSQVAAPQEKK